MRRVRIMHAVRPFLSGTALASFLFLLAVWGIGREVWVAHVFANMPAASDVTAVTRFFAMAFLNTRFVVQVLTVLAAASLIWGAREVIRTSFVSEQRFA